MDAESQRNIDLAKEAFGRRRSDLAEAFLRSALAVEPTHPWAVTALSAAMRYQGRYPEAAEQARLAMRLYPTSGYAHITLATVLAIMDENEEALAHGHEALRLMPQHPRHYRLVSSVLHELGRFSEAIEMAMAGLSVRADDVPLKRALAIALAAAARRDEALAVLAEVFRVEPAERSSFSVAAFVAWLLNEPAIAIRHARDAIRLKPTSAEPHGVLGLAMLDLGDLPQAAVHLGESLRLNPYNKRIRAALDRLSSSSTNGLGA